MKLSKHQYVAFLDDDDEWVPEKLNIQKRLLSLHPEVAGIFTNFRTTNSSGHVSHNHVFNWGQPIKSWEVLLGKSRQLDIDIAGKTELVNYYLGDHYFNQMLDDYILPTSLVINRAVSGYELYFEVGMQRNESWFFTSKVSAKGPMIYVDSDLACQHGDAEQRLTAASKSATIRSRLYVIENEFGRNRAFLAQHRKAYECRLRREVVDLIKTNILGDEPLETQTLATRYSNLGLDMRMLSLIPSSAWKAVRWWKQRGWKQNRANQAT